MSDAKPSPVEGVKENSRQLRGTIGRDLGQAAVDHFDHDDATLLKFHGTYQQDDRDHRGEKNADGTAKGKAYMFMVRSRIPGGKLTAAQFMAELDLADRYGNQTLRITSRQGFQHHGVHKENLRATIKGINDIRLTTLAACGDVNRNVMCCPAPIKNNAVRDQMQQMAFALAEHLKPRTTGYCEIWLRDENGEEQDVSEFQPVEEPIYGTHYLPRKFKVALALPEDNCVDIYANDLGFLAIHDGKNVLGYNVLVGGGMGVTPSAKKTFPAVAKKLAYIAPEQVLDVATAIVKVQRDFGNRSDRKLARMKYLIANWGLPAFKAKVEEYYGQPLAEPHPADVTDVDDHLGWHEQGDGKLFLGVNVPNGRIKDEEHGPQHKTAFREILDKYGMDARLTPLQSVILCDVAPQDRADIDAILAKHQIVRAEEQIPLRRYAIACPAWPTCGLSITESERVMPSILDELEQELAKYALSRERITLHMTGCPNGCARPYTPDIGLVGKAAGEKYTLFLGGSVLGNRIAFNYADMLPREEIAATLSPVLALYKAERTNRESLGDFCVRVGKERLEAFAGEFGKG